MLNEYYRYLALNWVLFFITLGDVMDAPNYGVNAPNWLKTIS